MLSVDEQKARLNTILNTSTIEDEITELSAEEFEKNPPTLSLSFSFYEKGEITYNYNEYLEHLKLTKEYVKNNKNYKLNCSSYNTFKNIQITICDKKWVMLSKDNSPSIHFVIHHPKLRNAIENFIPPIVE